jgi:sulfite exporter TauE/SafE/copper chaperone CopZ
MATSTKAPPKATPTRRRVVVERTVPIAGMTCGACEVRVAKKLRKMAGVIDVSVSQRKGQAIIHSTHVIPPAQIAQAVKSAGYEVGRARPAWLTTDRVVWRDAVTAAVVMIAIILGASALGFGQITNRLSAWASGGSVILIVLLGVAASLSTCMALVGGLVLGLSTRFAAAHPDATTTQRLRPQLLFHAGRVVGFIGLGALLGVVGQAFTLTGPTLALLTIAVAIVMGWIGLKLTGLSPRLAATAFHLPSSWTAWMRRDGSETAPYRDSNAAILGAGSFFLPCGFTQAVQLYALSTGSPGQAGLIMGLFALGTVPGLLGVGAAGALAKGHGGQRFFRVAGVAVIGFALINLSGALGALLPSGLSSLGTGNGSTQTVVQERSPNVTDVGGVQVVATTQGGGYKPNPTIVYANEPVRWEITSEYLGCDSSLNLSSLGLDYIALSPGLNTLEFTAPAAGTYVYSCSMGMFRAQFIVIDRPTAAPTEEGG